MSETQDTKVHKVNTTPHVEKPEATFRNDAALAVMHVSNQRKYTRTAKTEYHCPVHGNRTIDAVAGLGAHTQRELKQQNCRVPNADRSKLCWQELERTDFQATSYVTQHLAVDFQRLDDKIDCFCGDDGYYLDDEDDD